MLDNIENCLNCGNAKSTHWSSVSDEEYGTLIDDVFEYRKCSQCDVIFICKNLENNLKDIYPSNYYSFVNSGYSPLYRIKLFLDSIVYRSIAKDLSSRIEVLDIGGGIGKTIDVIKKSFWEKEVVATIVDIDAGANSIAQSKGYKYVQGDFTEMNLKDSFDLILALNIVEHVINPSDFVASVRKALKAGGFAVFQTPNHDSIDAKLFSNRYWGGLHAPRHFVVFSDSSFKHLLQNNGLEIVKYKNASGSPFWACSILGSFKGLSHPKPFYSRKLYTFLLFFFSIVDVIRSPWFKTSQQFVVVRKSFT